MIMFGAWIKGTSYSGCIYDTHNQTWLSKVSLGLGERSFNFDPVYKACCKFRDFVVPLSLSTYKPAVEIDTEMPIVTCQFRMPQK